MFYGLSRDDTGRLAYECTVKYNMNLPTKWQATEKATLAWIKGFQKRHANLTVQKSLSICSVMIFPRVHFKDFMIHGAPPGTLGLG